MSSIGFVFTFINLMNIAAYVVLLVVAIYFWRRYPRPSLYLAIRAVLEIFGSLLQTAFQVVLSWGFLAHEHPKGEGRQRCTDEWPQDRNRCVAPVAIAFAWNG